MQIPGAKDPDEYIKNYGPERVEALLDGVGNALDFRLKRLRDQYDLSQDAQRLQYIKDAVEMLAERSNPTEQEVYAGRLAEAEDFLMIPEYLLWKLCGVKAREYTNATSTGLVNAQTGEYDPEILKALGLPETMFPKLTAPGTVLGALKADIATEVGGQTKVVLCATHDTASAVEGIPMELGDALVFAVLIIVLLVKPTGLLGKPMREKV